MVFLFGRGFRLTDFAGLTRSRRDTASLNSNGIGGFFFWRGTAQGRPSQSKTAAGFVPAVSSIARDAIVGLVSALCALRARSMVHGTAVSMWPDAKAAWTRAQDGDSEAAFRNARRGE